jgi:tRNA threonylcarbamoyladenosine biosynthesis protein TsaB
MRALVLDTALGACQAGLFDGETALAVLERPMEQGGMERIAGLTRELMQAAGAGFDVIDRIGVTAGPGSFTGLRVGLAFAQGLGAALGRPVIGLSSLDGLAASTASDGAVMAVIDARRGQVYARAFRDGSPLDAPEALDLDQARARAQALGPGLRLVGSGAPLAAEGLDRAEIVALAAPSLTALARLTRMADPETAPPRPLYLRAPDAKPSTRRPGAPRTAA